ncbi:MAG: hypothetical protein RI897_1261 [Verrucomicrobiota bacterium]|jgi:hypothetical protein
MNPAESNSTPTMHRLFLQLQLLLLSLTILAESPGNPFPGERGEKLDLAARADLWNTERQGFLHQFVKVPRDQVIGFGLYTHEKGTLKITAQLYPLKPEEPREVRLELLQKNVWTEVARSPVIYPGWSAHFRVPNWNNSLNVRYRLRHGETASFEGLIRKDPVDKPSIVVATLSCNSNADREGRDEIIRNLKQQDPDLLFFAGDQSYDHTEHTAAWLLWGQQFREIIRDRPVITIPDDHDIGQGNVWGENGIVADAPDGSSGGYFYPAEYINMVHRCQTWHLPDPVDPAPSAQNISVYFTRLHIGGVDFAILADRQFKSGPKGKIPRMGPRPDHIQEAGYDPQAIDLPNLTLLGDRQLNFLNSWAADWEGTTMKAALSQTAFCGAVHLHGSKENRLLADLDCNGWPQTGRNKALEALRRALACHLCGDQHLAALVQHGIQDYRDGPFAFTVPAIINSYYGRWWWPKDERHGEHPIANSPLPWTGDYLDGLYNRITMLAYANPDFDRISIMKQRQRDPSANLGDGYGVTRFNKINGQITFECWPRYADLQQGDKAQFAGWPVTIHMEQNDGRKITGYLPELVFENATDPVVQVVREDSGEVLYTRRIRGNTFRPHVYAAGSYTIQAGLDRPDAWTLRHVDLAPETAPSIRVTLEHE